LLTAFEVVFWISTFLVLYTYVFYPVILLLLGRFSSRNKRIWGSKQAPHVSVLVAFYNEADILRERLDNLKSVDYPKGKLEILFGSDGSTDKPERVFHRVKLPRAKLVTFRERRGKPAVLNDLVARAKGDVIVFSDANTSFSKETIRNLVRHFEDAEVGAVCGELRLRQDGNTVGGFGEKVYWHYETVVKKLESKVHSTLAATGAVYAIRRPLYTPLPTDKAVMDDFLISMSILEKGYKVKYDSTAIAYEKPANSIEGEFRRKARIGAANFHGFAEFRKLMHPRMGFVAFALWSHKIIRWVVPFLLIVMAVSSSFLWPVADLYRSIAFVEIAFGILVMTGLICDKLNIPIGSLGLPYYFIAIHVALLVGFLRFLTKKQRPAWEVVR
jgi:cellulose synthase/poly-beta-1,6-N-acetylglucosamine synthase-like glycosyltransferase